MLRALQNGEIVRVGSEHVIHVDVRVLAATNKDLARAVAGGTFREDLFFRLDVFPIRVPGAARATEDIPLLADAFIAAFCQENGLKPKPIDRVVYEALTQRKWPGNVRELKNVVERAAILSGRRHHHRRLARGSAREPVRRRRRAPTQRRRARSHEPLTSGQGRATLREYREVAERTYIVETLKELDWNISKAAVLLGVERTNLHKKIRAYGIKRGGA